MAADPLTVVVDAAARWRWQLAAAGHRDQAAAVDRALHVVVRTAGLPGPLAARWATTTEAAAELDVDPSTIRRWCATGKLPAQRRGSRWLIDRTRCGLL